MFLRLPCRMGLATLILMSAMGLPTAWAIDLMWPSEHGPLSPVLHPRVVARAYAGQLAGVAEGLGEAATGARGPEVVRVYESASPAIIMVTDVDGRLGHGTGFFISADGWLLTNNHVIAHLPVDRASGNVMARIVYGVLDEDSGMKHTTDYLPAILYRADERRDLALLKVTRMPKGQDRVPFIPLASRSPLPGSDCIVIGHPAAGTLWTLRTGVVASGKAEFPHDQINHPAFLVGADLTAEERLQMADMLEQVEPRFVVLSDCGLNPGDSGGPLLDGAGQLIGVSFAIPAFDEERQVDQAKFSYHVHLDEVREFTKSLPDEPDVVPPSPYPPARLVEKKDLTGDGVDDALFYYLEEDGSPTGLVVDLDQDSSTGKNPVADNKLSTLDPVEDWDSEFALVLSPMAALFFDTDNDGAHDLILAEQDGAAYLVRYQLRAGQWQRDTVTLDLGDFNPYVDRTLKKRYAQVSSVLFK